MRMILKFDTGADGFKKMIYVLAFSALALIVLGLCFLRIVITEMKGLS